jgi:hypothetical protein
MAIPDAVSFPGVHGFFTTEDLLLVQQGVAEFAGCAPVSGAIEHLNQDVTNRMLLATFDYLSAKQPGYWTAAHWQPPAASKLRAYDDVYLELNRVLPVPSADTPIHDVLEFKDRRRSELDALRGRIDEVYLTFASSADPARVLEIAKKSVVEELAAIQACLNESKIRSVLSKIEIGLSISPTMVPGLVETISHALHFPVTAVELVVGTVSIGIGQSIINHQSNAVKRGPYRLLYKGFEEGIFRRDEAAPEWELRCSIGQIWVGTGSSFETFPAENAE